MSDAGSSGNWTNGQPATPPQQTYATTAPETSGLAVASLVAGILSFLCVGPLASIPSIIMGHIALSRIRRDPQAIGGSSMATAGLILGYVNIVIVAILIFVLAPMMAVFLPAFTRSQEASRRASCANNLKQMGIVFKMFAGEQDGQWPELSSEPGRLMFANQGTNLTMSVFPELLTDTSILVCPSDSGDLHLLRDRGADANPQLLINDQSYFYLGYVVTNDMEVETLANAYRERVSKGLKFDEDLFVPQDRGSGARTVICRLREGVERYFIADMNKPAASGFSQAEIPVIIERPEHHIPSGSNVLFMDGHVEFIRYPGKWPMTETTIGILESLAGP